MEEDGGDSETHSGVDAANIPVTGMRDFPGTINYCLVSPTDVTQFLQATVPPIPPHKARPTIICRNNKSILEILLGNPSLKFNVKGSLSLGMFERELENYVSRPRLFAGKCLPGIRRLIKERNGNIPEIMRAMRERNVQEGYDAILSTAHSAKGLEFHYVALWEDMFRGNLNVDPIRSGSLLSPKADEERNIRYTSVTRATHHLWLPPAAAKFDPDIDWDVFLGGTDIWKPQPPPPQENLLR